MIAVIADDFTGAAEIGGIGLRYGLNVVIETEVNTTRDIDILIIATDTRSLGEEEAASEVSEIVSQLLKLNPDFIFKKIDSVLRGHIAKELVAQMQVTAKETALVVAANPSAGRTIINGQYFVDSVPLNETSFASDPDFPVQSAFVTDIVRSGNISVASIKLPHNLNSPGLFIADVGTPEDLVAWTGKIGPEMVLAGGAVFFDALLASLYKPNQIKSNIDLSFGESSLFIFGSKYPRPVDLYEKLQLNSVVRINMPAGIYYRTGSYPDLMKTWTQEVIDNLEMGKSVLVTIDHKPGNEVNLQFRLRENIGQLVAEVEQRFRLHDLLIEGGATTSVILRYLNVRKLIPVSEAELGVIQMKADDYPDLCITTKPGSYLWPDNLFPRNF
jgi:D-threonate/D-erythronate kinase